MLRLGNVRAEAIKEFFAHKGKTMYIMLSGEQYNIVDDFHKDKAMKHGFKIIEKVDASYVLRG